MLNKNSTICLIEDEKVIELIKVGIVGGPSIVFHRHHKVGETMIRKPFYVGKDEHGAPIWKVPDKGKLVHKIQGYDANALYLYCLSQPQLCGELVYHECDGTVSGEYLSTMFGIMIVDLEVPPELYNYFSEYPPIFVNLKIEKDRKLVSVYSVKKISNYYPIITLVFKSWNKIN